MNKKSVNVGFSLLKILMCFEVIICHFFSNSQFITAEPFYFIRKYSVPTFMFISFYFIAKHLENKDKRYLFKRIKKLYYPLLLWGLLYYLFYKVVLCDFRELTINDLIWQILTGHSEKINTAMWFQVVLIMLTVIFYFIFKYVKGDRKRILKYCLGIGCLALILQYTEWNYNVFCNLRFELKYPLGRFVEMIPPAILAIIVSDLDIYEKFEKRSKMFIIIFPFICVLMKLISKYSVRMRGFGYHGIEMTIFAFCITGFFFILSKMIHNKKLIEIINKIASCTLGIYCMHMLVGSVMLEILLRAQIILDDFILCILIFIFSYILSRLCLLSSCKYIKNLVS